jgi:hypothetical protein
MPPPSLPTTIVYCHPRRASTTLSGEIVTAVRLLRKKKVCERMRTWGDMGWHFRTSDVNGSSNYPEDVSDNSLEVVHQKDNDDHERPDSTFPRKMHGLWPMPHRHLQLPLPRSQILQQRVPACPLARSPGRLQDAREERRLTP